MSINKFQIYQGIIGYDTGIFSKYRFKDVYKDMKLNKMIWIQVIILQIIFIFNKK